MNEETKGEKNKNEKENPENLPDSPQDMKEESQDEVLPETLAPPVEDDEELKPSSMDEESQEEPPPPQEETDEEIIFPQKPPSKAPYRPAFSMTNFIGLILLLAGVYLLGYLTNPEKFNETVKNVKETFSLAVKEIGPLEEKVTAIIEEKIKEIPGSKQKPNPAGEEELPGQDGRKIKYWQAPMDPSYIRDKPGKSPMLMDLVPVYEDEMEYEGIRINPTITQNIGVKTEKVKFRKLTRTIRTIGRLTYDERKVMHIHTKYEGWIEKLHVDYTGKKVSKGDLLMEIYSPELVSTQEELLLALKYSESFKDNPYPEIILGADRLLNSTRRKLELLDFPQHQIDTLVKDRKISKTVHIHSPVNGFVINKPAVHGMRIKPGMSLYTIADLSNIWVLADIYEYELPWVKIGQPVKMELPYYPGKEFKGKITYIDPYLESKTRTIKVRMEFENINWELKPNMYSNITLESVIAKKSVAVSEESVIHSGEKDLVVIVNKSGGFESRGVTLGAAADGYYQVLKGLKGGEEVVTSSHFLLDSESSLKEGILKLEDTPEKPMDDEKMPMMEMKPLQEMKSIPGIEQNNMDMKMGGESAIILKEDTHGR